MPPESDRVLTVYRCACGKRARIGSAFSGFPCSECGCKPELVCYLPEAETVPLAAVERFLAAWDEFDGPPLTPQETYNAVAESVEGLRQSVPEREET